MKKKLFQYDVTKNGARIVFVTKNGARRSKHSMQTKTNSDVVACPGQHHNKYLLSRLTILFHTPNMFDWTLTGAELTHLELYFLVIFCLKDLLHVSLKLNIIITFSTNIFPHNVSRWFLLFERIFVISITFFDKNYFVY